MIAFWIGLIILLVVIEAISTQLVGIWFAIASLICLILAMVGAPVWVQIIVFIVVSAALLIFTRPIAKKLLLGSPEHTNADRYIGMTAVVAEVIDNDLAKGQVRVGGQVWSARSQNGEILQKDEKATVVAIEGVKLIVTPVVN